MQRCSFEVAFPDDIFLEIKKGSCRYEGMMSPPDYARCYYSHAVTTLSWQQSKADNDRWAS
jgi:hypothetical protein